MKKMLPCALVYAYVHRTVASSCRARCAAARLALFAPHEPADADVAFVVSSEEARAILSLRDAAPDSGFVTSKEEFSVDLGHRSVHMVALPSGVALDAEDCEPCATWDELARIVKKMSGAWQCHWGATGIAVARIEGYSDVTGRTASLLPIPGGVPPTVVLGENACLPSRCALLALDCLRFIAMTTPL